MLLAAFLLALGKNEVGQRQEGCFMDSEKEQKESLDYAIARDKLIRQGVLPDDPIVKADDAYWEQFK